MKLKLAMFLIVVISIVVVFSVNINAKYVLDKQFKVADIFLDNTPPKLTFTEEKLSDGRSKGIILADKKIQEVDGWKLSEDEMRLEKEFESNTYYEMPVYDYLDNKGSVIVHIQFATYIKLKYCSHNSGVGWTYGYENYDIAGRAAVLKNPLFKTEALAFNVEGNIPNDFVQAQAYVYTYWGPGSANTCLSSGMKYTYGYNPSETTYKSMASTDKVNINGKQYFQLGGAGINTDRRPDINGNNPIPDEYMYKYYFGVSAIKIRLKDISYYSIVYQIYVNGVGWLKPAADGEETCYQKEKPMSAFRVTIVPNTEKQYVIDNWSKDIGTNNMNR